MKRSIYLALLALFLSCYSGPPADDTAVDNDVPLSTSPDPRDGGKDPASTENGISREKSIDHFDDTYHEDDRFKYEFRTGEDGDYIYNYDVFGYDEEGRDVSGNIYISGKYGEGYIQDQDGNEKYVDVEWVDWGVLEGFDEEGTYYQLEVED